MVPFEEETTAAAMTLLSCWIQKYGIPQALYCDRKNAYICGREPGLDERMNGIRPRSHFEKACDKLGIEVIAVNSPQAKGTVERNHAVYQERLVKELRLAGISTLEGANRFLEQTYLPNSNAQFSVPSAHAEDAHIPLGTVPLHEILCREHDQVVNNDFVVMFAFK